MSHAVTAAHKRYTADDLWELSHRTGKRYELVKGELVELTPTVWQHGAVTANLTRLLANYVLQQELGVVLGGNGVHTAGRCPCYRARGGRGFRFAKASCVHRLPRGYAHVAPDLVVEVLSPGDNFLPVTEKVQDWLRAGARTVWVGDPSERRVNIHKPDAAVLFLTENDTLSDPEVLPGFGCSVKEIFTVLAQE